MMKSLGADGMLNLMTWVDIVYTVYNDTRIHTGDAMSFKPGMIMYKLTKQKLNNKSLTKSEVVGASDYLPGVVWAEIFLEHQCIILEHTKVLSR